MNALSRLCRERATAALHLMVACVGALSTAVAFFSAGNVIALAVLGATICLLLTLFIVHRYSDSRPDHVHIRSAEAVASVGVIAMVMGIALWIQFGSITRSVSLFIMCVGLVAASRTVIRYSR